MKYSFPSAIRAVAHLRWLAWRRKAGMYRTKMQTTVIWLGLGGNVPGRWGPPPSAFDRAVAALEEAGLRVVARSALYETAPVGSVRQPDFCNAVVGVRGSITPAALLRLLKRLERRAGRRPNGRWGPRPLDIDILAFRGTMLGRPARKCAPGRLTLPHPELPRRGFVLVPLAEVASHWHHPHLKRSAATLLRSRPQLVRGVRRAAAPHSGI